MRNRIVLLAVVIGLLVGVAGIGLLVVTDDDDGTSVAADLPKLPIGAYGERTMAAADMMLAGPVEWRVRGDLPKLDDHATAYRVVAPSESAQQKLFAALGDLPAGVGPTGDWSAPADNTGVDDCTVTTREGPPDAPVACSRASGSVSSSIAVACTPDGECPEPAPPPPPADLPSRAEAQRIALETFEAAGIDTTGHVEVFGPGDAWEVSAEPRVGGRRVFGAANNLSVGSKGKILRGAGQLLTTDTVGEYPLVSSSDGLERLKAQWGGAPAVQRGGAEPAIAIAPGEPVPDGQPPQPIVRTITGVTLGLQPTYGAETNYLAPVFLFETDEGGVVPVPAVTDEYLEQPGGGGVPEPAPVPLPAEPPQQVDPAPPVGGGGSGGSTGSSEVCAGSASGSSAGGDPNQPLAVEVCASPSNPRVGETVTFHLKASDPDAAIDTDGCSQPRAAYGDERDESVTCMSICQKDNPSPASTTLAKTFTHAYKQPGPYKAVFTVGSCAPNASTGTVAVQITVRG